jgi:hypothetical protein
MSGELLDAVDTAIQLIQAKLLTPDGAKGSLTDLVRLLQLRKELEGDRPRQINARWIEEEDECPKSKD